MVKEKNYKTVSPDSAEGKYIADMRNSVKNIRDAFFEGAVAASNNAAQNKQNGNKKANELHEQKEIRHKSRVTSEQDSTYLDAVKRGDMKTAQRMVDEAAKAAGYTIKAYHGTPINNITVFDSSKIGSTTDEGIFGHGFYFSTNKLTADGYATVDGKTMPVFLRVEKTWWGLGHTIQDVAKELDMAEDSLTTKKNGLGTIVAPSSVSNRSFTSHLIERGYDSVIIQHGKRDYEIVIFNNKNVKSADPVTYDDNGNVIPLSERFNESNKDIRYKSRNVDNTMTNGTYSYSALTSKPDLKVIEFSGTLPLNSKGEIDKNKAIARGRANARKQKNPKNTETSTYVYVDDLGIDVLLSKNGMTHGIVRSPETASAVMQIGDVLKNSFAINELEGSRERKTEMSYVLLGACKDAENIYVVRSVVSKLLNEVTEIDVFQLSAIKGKKIETPTSALGGTAVTERRSLISSESSVISIADFLGYVKTIPLANEVFSQNVAEYLEIERHQGTLSKDLRHKSRSTVTTGQYEQMKANLSHSKVYSKKSAMELVKRIAPGIRNRSFETLSNQLWEGLNAYTNVDDKRQFAKDMSEMFIDRMRVDTVVKHSEWDAAVEKMAYLNLRERSNKAKFKIYQSIIRLCLFLSLLDCIIMLFYIVL